MNPHLPPTTDDQSPDARPAPAPVLPRHGSADQRLVRLHETYVQKVNSVVEAGRHDLAEELATTFAQESAGTRRAPRVQARRTGAGRRGPGRTQTPRSMATTATSSRVRRLLHRFDQYTLEVFNAGTPVRPVD